MIISYNDINKYISNECTHSAYYEVYVYDTRKHIIDNVLVSDVSYIEEYEIPILIIMCI